LKFYVNEIMMPRPRRYRDVRVLRPRRDRDIRMTVLRRDRDFQKMPRDYVSRPRRLRPRLKPWSVHHCLISVTFGTSSHSMLWICLLSAK